MTNIPPVLFAFFGIVVALTLPFIFWLRRESRAAGGFKTWMSDLNMTTFRTLEGMFLAAIVVLTNLLTNVLQINVNIEQVEATYWFVFGMLGVEATAWIAKRATDKTVPDPIAQPMGERRTVIEESVPVNPVNAQPPTASPERPVLTDHDRGIL